MSSGGNELSRLIRSERLKQFEKGVDFWKKFGEFFKISYSHYNHIENGKKLPDIDTCLTIAKVLNISEKKICLTWALVQMPNNELKRYFRTEKDISLKTLPNQGRLNLSKYFVFSKTHSDYLQSNPTAWQVVGFIASNSVKNILFTPKEIAKTLCTSEIEIKKYLSWLVDIGAVIKNKENYIPTKENFFLPSDPEFQKLRSINFRETSQRLSLKIKDEDPKNIQDFKFTYGGTLNEQTSLLIKEHLEQVRDFITSKNDINGKYFEIVIGMAPLKN